MKAAIDIGTNTVLLLVAKLDNNAVQVLHEEQRMPRLGKGVDADGAINPKATDRVIQALKDHQKILKDKFSEIDEVVVTATSAVRDASNRAEFLAKVKTETGFNIRLLSGDEEAEWTTAGALSALQQTINEAIVLDIGGGSTEVALVKKGVLLDSHSFDMGSVRFTERFLKSNPPTPAEMRFCRDEISRLFNSRDLQPSPDAVAVGVAGTVTTLAALIQNIREYEPESINGYQITKENLGKYIDLFSCKRYRELLKLAPNILKGREDIFLAGMLIVEGFMLHFNLKHLMVSTGGIRHGALLKT